MKRFFLIGLLILVSVIDAKAQYYYDWSIGGSFGVGPAEDIDGDTIAFGMMIDFAKNIQYSKWRWGVQGGIYGLGGWGFSNNTEDVYDRVSFVFIGGVADYSPYSRGISTIFIRAGIAPACQIDLYMHHKEHKFAIIGIAGIGADVGFNRFSLSFYLSHRGIPALLFSYGMNFGKKLFKSGN